MFEVRNPKFNGLYLCEKGEIRECKGKDVDRQSLGIDCEVNHPVYGWVPCSIYAHEYPEEFAAVVDQAAPYEPPPREVVVKNLRERKTVETVEVVAGLLDGEWITEEEAEQWIEGKLPQRIQDVFRDRPKASDRIRARAELIAPASNRVNDHWRKVFDYLGLNNRDIDRVFKIDTSRL